MRLLGIMVTKNEANRYLDASLAWLKTCVDEIHVFDDQSDDETPEIVLSHGCRLTVRPEGVPPFLDHEGLFRQAAWEAFERKLHPVEGDWVLSLDADEFLVSSGRPRLELIFSAQSLGSREAKSGIINIKEVWDIREVPYCRTDGWWDSNAHARFYCYEPAGHFPNRAMASGSHPTYVERAAKVDLPNLAILHYGYASDQDKRAKHERYRGLSGHNPVHIESILKPPRLSPWPGRFPCLT